MEAGRLWGLNLNTARYRTLDPQLGRWWQIDPEVEQFEAWSAYNSNLDNPIRYEDKDGDCPLCPPAIGFGVGAGVDIGFQAYKQYQEGGWDNVGNFNYTSAAISGTATATAVASAEIVVGLGLPIAGTITIIATQGGGIGALESLAKQILTQTDDNGNSVPVADAKR